VSVKTREYFPSEFLLREVEMMKQTRGARAAQVSVLGMINWIIGNRKVRGDEVKQY